MRNTLNSHEQAAGAEIKILGVDDDEAVAHGIAHLLQGALCYSHGLDPKIARKKEG
jgi:hypothetical protein